MLTYNVKLNSTEEARFKDTLELQRKCWNFVSHLIFLHSPKGTKETHALVYDECRKRFPNLPAQYVIRSYNDVRAAYKSIKSNGHIITEPACKSSLSVRLDKRICSLKKNAILITAMSGKRIRFDYTPYPKLQKLLNTVKPCDPLVFFRDEQLWLSLSFKPFEKPVIENKILGVDLGEKRLYATSENEIFIDKSFNKRKRRIRFLKRSLRKRGTKSARRKARRTRRKEANMTKDLVHRATNSLLKTSANIIAIEDLKGIKKNTSAENKKKGSFGRRRNNKFSQIPLTQFRKVLEYKAGHAGKLVVMVSPYNTSQCDYRGIRKGKRNKIRYVGSDGTILDSDINAAINVAIRCAKKHKLPISFGDFKVPGLDGQAVVNQPNVFKSPHVGVLQASVL